MNQQIDLATTTILSIITGSLSSAIGTLFDVPPSTVFAAFLGVYIAVILAEEMSYKQALGTTFFGTCAAGYLTPVAMHFAPDMVQKSIAFAIGFAIINYRQEILDIGKKALTANPSALLALLKNRSDK